MLLEVLAFPASSPGPDRETRDMCTEALAALITNSAECYTEFLQQDGLAPILLESRRDDVLSSTQVTICEILDWVIVKGQVSNILRGKIRPAVVRMLNAQSGADDRVTSVDAKLCALQLVDKLCDHADSHQQAVLAKEAVQHFAECLDSYSTSLQLAVCHLLLSFIDNPATRAAVHDADLTPALIRVHKQQACLPTAPVIACIGRLSELNRLHADSTVRLNGLKAMLNTLENSTMAQAQRHALVSTTQVIRHASPSVLSSVLQTGSTVKVAALVLQHTESGQVSDQKQWVAWCCRVLADVATMDAQCKAKVVSVLSNADVSLLEMLQLTPNAELNADLIVPTLIRKAEAADCSFLAKVADSQMLAEAIAMHMVKGRHVLLKDKAKEHTGMTVETTPNRTRTVDLTTEHAAPLQQPEGVASDGCTTQVWHPICPVNAHLVQFPCICGLHH